MLSRQSASRPRLAAHRRNRGHDRLPSADGHARGAKAVSPTQPRDRVLPRLDQKQTGTAPIPPARLGQSANGNALGLPHLQPATVDPTAQAASRIRRRLKPQRRDRSREAPYANQTTLPLSHLHSTLALLLGYGQWFFHSFKAREVAHPQLFRGKVRRQRALLMWSTRPQSPTRQSHAPHKSLQNPHPAAV